MGHQSHPMVEQAHVFDFASRSNKCQFSYLGVVFILYFEGALALRNLGNDQDLWNPSPDERNI